MAQTLTPVPEIPGYAGLAMFQQAVTPTDTALEFSNTGNEVLIVLASGSGTTVQVTIGEQVDGLPVEPPAPVPVAAGDPTMFGPFGSEYNQPAQGLVQVLLNSLTAVQVILVQHVEVG
jgi:hypothetical protein